MAERVGFEPTVPVRYDGFQDRSVMTTSVSLHRCYNMLAYPRGYVNRFLRNFTHKKNERYPIYILLTFCKICDILLLTDINK